MKWQILSSIIASCLQMGWSVHWRSYYLGFFCLCKDTSVPLLFASRCGRILQLLCLFWFLQPPRMATRCLFLFSRKWHHGSSSWWFLRSPQILACFLSTLPVYWSSLLPPHSGVCTRGQLQSGGRYEFSTQGLGGVPVDPLGRSAGVVFPEAQGRP